jgi:glycosyltransferase involved in cell wall biosynthesis
MLNKISIITVVYNGEEFLEKTIKSVLSQSYENIEYIIIDGGSTDGTVEIIEKYKENIDYWISEKDDGIYDAMNKGIEVSNGKGVLFLNAGDYFVGEVLHQTVQIPSFLPIKFHNRFGNLVSAKIKNYKQGIPNSHQGILFENRGLKYDLSYKVASDYNYFLKHGYDDALPCLLTNGYVYYDNVGLSSISYKKRDSEILKIIKDNFGLFYAFTFYIKSKTKSFVKDVLK